MDPAGALSIDSLITAIIRVIKADWDRFSLTPRADFVEIISFSCLPRSGVIVEIRILATMLEKYVECLSNG
jgi:hypothetical protein